MSECTNETINTSLQKHQKSQKLVNCWLCDSAHIKLKKKGMDETALTPTNFAVTDLNYGQTLSIYQCQKCGFLFCPGLDDATDYYIGLEDRLYEETRDQRSLQAKQLLRIIGNYCAEGNLLDIGAGSGILVEQSLKRGYRSIGIEPCSWMVKSAKKLSLPIIEGTFPDAVPQDSCYDVITLIDVIEHVHSPLKILKETTQFLKDNGLVVMVTPDVNSLAAKILGKKWWHYRIAHISYFNKSTIRLAFKKAGLEIIHLSRPSWYFPMSYLLERVNCYVPIFHLLLKIKLLNKLTVPLNLFDSWMVIGRKIK